MWKGTLFCPSALRRKHQCVLSTVGQNFGALDPVEGEIFWGNEIFYPLPLTSTLTLIIGGVKFGIYGGIYGVYMPAKFGHPRLPVLHNDETETAVFSYCNWLQLVHG